MQQGKRKLALLLVGGATAVGVAACGGIPGDAVVAVNGTPITKAEFDHWLRIAVDGPYASVEGGKQATPPPVPEPPDFTACIQHLEATEKSKQTNPSQLKSQCQNEYEAYKTQVLDFLISSQWVLGEAQEEGIKVSNAEARKEFETLKKAQFPKESQYQAYLARSGETEADLLRRVKLQLLARKIEEKVTKSAQKTPSKAEIAKYYSEHKAAFTKPESRNIELILTKGEAEAKSAKGEIEAGKPFSEVAKAVSIDPVSKANGGVLDEVTRGSEEKALSEAIFSAKVGVLSGPVKTPFGYYIFRVTKVNPATEQTLAQAEPLIVQTIKANAEQKALTAFIKQFREKWRERTECRTGYVVPDCKEYKLPKGATGAAG